MNWDTWLGPAAECPQCGRPYCRFCSIPGYCSACANRRRASKGIDVSLRLAADVRRLTRRRDLACRILSLALPGSHRFLSGKPISGFLTLFLFFFLRDGAKAIEAELKARGAVVNGFVLYVVGEGIEKKKDDFAAEVAAMAKA